MDGQFYTLGLNTSGFDGPLSRSSGLLGGFGGKLPGIGLKLAGLAAGALGVGSALGGMAKAITAAADMESLEVAFETLIGDGDKAAETLGKIKDLAASTPFEFPELAQSARKLIAFGEGADTVDQTMRRLGDVAAGVQAPIGEIAEIYGKIRTQGTLYNEDLNQLAGRGIPVIQTLAEGLGVSAGEVKKMASQGQITFPMLEEGFKAMTREGGQFHGMMQAQSETTNGLLSTLRDGVGEIFRVLGAPINDAIRPMLEDAIDLTQRVGNGISAGVQLARSAFDQGKLGELVGMSLELAFKGAVNVLFRGLQGAASGAVAYFSGLGNVAIAQFEMLTNPDFWSGLLDTFLGIASAFGGAVIEILAPVLAALDIKRSKSDYQEIGRLVREEGVAEAKDGAVKIGEAGLTNVAETWLANVKNAGEEAARGFREGNDAFETDGLRSEIKDLAKAIDPEATEKLLDAFRGRVRPTEGEGPAPVEEAPVNLRDLLEDPAKKGPAGGGGVGGGPVFSTLGIADEEEQGRRRGTLSAAESLRTRYARMSGADKARFGSFGAFANHSALDRIALREGGGLGGITASALAGAGPAHDQADSPASLAQILKAMDDKIGTIADNFAVV